jgi:hypothetical protein
VVAPATAEGTATEGRRNNPLKRRKRTCCMLMNPPPALWGLTNFVCSRLAVFVSGNLDSHALYLYLWGPVVLVASTSGLASVP